MRNFLIVFLLLSVLFPGWVLGATPPTSTTRPLILLNPTRIAELQAKQSASTTAWTFSYNRAVGFLTSEPWEPPEQAALQALIWQVTGTQAHFDRAKELLFEYMINMDDATYWHHVRSTLDGVSTLASSIDATSTTITVSDAGGFEYDWVLEEVPIAIEEELISCSSIAGTTLSGCQRGQHGTTATSHTAGVYMEASHKTFGERDAFRGAIRYLVFAYDWLYNGLTVGEREQIRNKFKLMARWWAYWLQVGVGSANPRGGGSDSDENTMGVEALLMIGIALHNDDSYSDTALEHSDSLRAWVQTNYIDSVMEGGIWSEGPNYSANTIQYWLISELINLETRGLSYSDASFMSDLVKGWHQLTFPGYGGILLYEDVETFTSDYLHMAAHGRYELASLIEGVATSDTDKELMRYWRQRVVTNDGEPTDGDIISGMYRLLFVDENGTATAPTDTTVPLSFQADGMNFVSHRTDWTDNACVVYSYGRQDTVDHIHQIGGHFDIVWKGVYVTKEITGYGPGLTCSYAMSHNMVSVENRNRGGSLGRYAVGDADILRMGSSSNYGLTKYDTQPLFDFGGSIPETPVLVNQRTLFFIKNHNLLFVRDRIEMDTSDTCSWDGTYINTANQGINTDCSRDKKLYQHFQTEPSLVNGAYTAVSEGVQLWFTPLTPATTATIVNESTTEPWASATGNDIPSHQKKWHVRLDPVTDSDNEEFITVLHWDDDGQSNLAATSVSATGASVAKAGDVVAVFSPGSSDIAVATYTVDATEHYVTDLPLNTDVVVERGGVAIAASPINSESDGVIEFTAAAGSEEYVVTAGTPTETCSDEIQNQDETSVDCGGVCGLTSCSTQLTCEGAGGNWCTDTCQEAACGGGPVVFRGGIFNVGGTLSRLIPE